MLQVVGYAICTACAIGAGAGFVAVGWQLGKNLFALRLQIVRVARPVQVAAVSAGYVPNAPATPHNLR